MSVLDLDEVSLPTFDIKVNGKVYKLDGLAVGAHVEDIQMLSEVEKVSFPQIAAKVNAALKEMGVDEKLSTYQALTLLNKFNSFALEELGEPLKNVLERSPSSTTTTDLDQEISEPSPEESTTD